MFERRRRHPASQGHRRRPVQRGRPHRQPEDPRLPGGQDEPASRSPQDNPGQQEHAFAHQGLQPNAAFSVRVCFQRIGPEAAVCFQHQLSFRARHYSLLAIRLEMLELIEFHQLT